MFPLLILSVTSLSLTLGATNWPVFFEHLGNVHSIHNKWDLSLSIDTRLTEFEVRKEEEVLGGLSLKTVQNHRKHVASMQSRLI